MITRKPQPSARGHLLLRLFHPLLCNLNITPFLSFSLTHILLLSLRFFLPYSLFPLLVSLLVPPSNLSDHLCLLLLRPHFGLRTSGAVRSLRAFFRPTYPNVPPLSLFSLFSHRSASVFFCPSRYYILYCRLDVSNINVYLTLFTPASPPPLSLSFSLYVYVCCNAVFLSIISSRLLVKHLG